MKKMGTSITIENAGAYAFENEGQKNLSAFVMCRIIPGFLILAGFFGILFTGLGFEMPGSAYGLMTLGAFAIYALTAYLRGTKKLYSAELLIVALAVLILVFACHTQMRQSLAYWLNAVKDWLYLNTGVFYQDFADEGCMWALGTVITVAAAIATEALIWAFKARITAVIALLYLLMVIMGYADFNAYGAVLIAGTVLALSAGMTDSGKSLAAALVILAAVMAVGAVIFALSGGNNGTLPTKDAASKAIHGLIYEDSETGLTEGHLTDLGAKKATGESELKVSMSSPSCEYIKGFTGSTYTGQAWETLSASGLSEEKELLYSLQSSGFYSSSQVYMAAELSKAGDEEDGKNTVTISTDGACRYLEYLPYGADTQAALSGNSIVSEGAVKGSMNDVTFETYPLSNAYIYMNALSALGDDESAQDYLSKEAAYRDFVYEHYLDVPENISGLLDEYGLSGDGNISTTQARSEVTKALKSVLAYDETAKTLNGNMDFLTYLLDYSQKGYDVHYASLAVMMMRSLGIPARYAEGYLITGDEASGLGEGDTYDVTDKNAHAWAEIYLDGVGWIVFDPTPGYTSEIQYDLPVGDEKAEEAANVISRNISGNETAEEPEDEEQEIERQNVETEKEVSIPVVISIVALIIIILLLLAIVIRSIILRKKLAKERDEMLHGDDLRLSSARIFAYARKVISYGCRIPENEVFEDPDGKVSGYLGISPSELAEIKALMDEIWLSGHSVTGDVKDSAAKWLQLVEKQRKEKTGTASLFISRYIKCNEY